MYQGLLPGGASWDQYPRRMNLGCGHDYRPGWQNADLYAAKVDLRFDLFQPPWSVPDESFDYVNAEQVLEHIPPLLGTQDGLLRVLEEVHRILRLGGLLCAGVPFANHPGDLENVTHYRRFVPRSLDFLDPRLENIGSLRHQTSARFRIVRRIVHRSFRLTRLLDSSYHLPKYVGFDPNVGRRRGVRFLLEKLPSEPPARPPSPAASSSARERPAAPPTVRGRPGRRGPPKRP